MTHDAFERLVIAAIDALPSEVADALDNVAFCVEDDSEDGELLGEYIGIPRTERIGDDSGSLPDKIVFYRLAIVDECDGVETEIVEEIRRTLWHEIAHHLGWDDDVLHAIETKKGWR
jgi:predicted Zn-dependent protease with MMP-like domain